MKMLLENIDLFGYQINFIYRHKPVYTSICSAVTSLLIYSMFFPLVHYFSKDMINQENPRIRYLEEDFEDEIQVNFLYFLEYIDLEINTTIIPISNIKTSNSSINEPGFNISKFFLSKNISIEDIFNVQIIISNDSEMDIGDEDLDFVKKVETINFKNTTNFKIEGSSVYFRYIINPDSIFHVNQKEELIEFEGKKTIIKDINLSNVSLAEYQFNVTKNTHMEFFLNIDYDFLKKNNLTLDVVKFDRRIRTKSTQINHNDNEFFSQSIQEKRYISPLRPLTYSQLDYTYCLYDVKDDIGFIFSGSKSILLDFHKTIISITRFDFILRKKLSYMVIKFLSTKKSYVRVYKKLQNVFADLSGIFSSVLMIGRIIVYAVNRKLFEYDTINLLFRNDQEDDLVKNKIKNIVKVEIYNRSLIKNEITAELNSLNNPKFDSSKVNLKNFICPLPDKEIQNFKKMRAKNRYYQRDKTNLNDQIIINSKSLANSSIFDSQRDAPSSSIEIQDNLERDSSIKPIYRIKKNTGRYIFNNEQEQTIKNFLIRNAADNVPKKLLSGSKNRVDISQHPFSTLNIKTRSDNGTEITNKLFCDKEKNNINPNEMTYNNNYLNIINLNNQEQNEKLKKYIKIEHAHISNLSKNETSIEENDNGLLEKIKNIINIYAKKNEYNLRNKVFDTNVKRKIVNFTYLEFLKTFVFCPKFKKGPLSNKLIIFEKAKTKIHEYLNVLNYFDMFEEMEKIKKIIFNDYQNVLFNFTRKRSYQELINDDLEKKLLKGIKINNQKIQGFEKIVSDRILQNSPKEIQEFLA